MTRLSKLLLVLLFAAFLTAPAYAVISTTQNQSTVSGNNATTVFSFNFVPDSATDISVIYTNSSGQQTTLSPSQYLVNIPPASPGQLWPTQFSITYPISGSPIASGTTLTVQRVLPLTQTTSLTNQGDYSPEITEQALDTGVMQSQQISSRTGQMRGTWIANAVYNFGDVVQDGASGNNTNSYYMCAIANTSSSWSTDLANGDWSLVIRATLPVTPIPIPVVDGGTGATTAGAALNNLGGISLSGNNAFTGNNTHTGAETFTGSISVPTEGAGDASSKAASTNFVNTTALTLAAGTTAITQSTSDNSTKVATDAFVQANMALSGVSALWTPALNVGGGTTGVTYTTQTGSYIQIGKLIVAEFRLIITSIGSLTGPLTITGLPAAENNNDRGLCTLSYYGGINYVTSPISRIDNSTSAIILARSDFSGVGIIGMSNSNISTPTEITGTCVYISS